MEVSEDKKKAILIQAEKVMTYCDLIIKTCDNWMPSEEADANLMREIIERNNTGTTAKGRGFKNSTIQRFNNSKIQQFNNSTIQFLTNQY